MARTHALARTTHHRHYLPRFSRSHHKHKMKVSLLMLAGLAPMAMAGIDGYKSHGGGVDGLQEAGVRVVARLTGYSISEEKFKVEELTAGWTPLLLAYMGHKMAGKVGLNRIMGRIGLPIEL